MSTWQERVQDELNELTVRLVKLRGFIATPEFRELSVAQCHLMVDQSHLMAQYADTLAARLSEEKGRS
jgi:hypothetical protein